MRRPASITLWLRTLTPTLILLAGCPGSGPARAPPNTPLTPSTHKSFPIDVGARHAFASCNDCHGAADTFKEANCLGCHAPAATDPKHALVGGYQSQTAACLRCHGDSQVERIADHKPFLLTSGTPHFKLSCLACHAATRADKPFAEDFTQKACLACHGEKQDSLVTRHAAIAGFTTESDTANCLRCHAGGGTAGSFAHAKFPVAGGTVHAIGSPAIFVPGNIACTSCHTSTADRTQIDCTTCHTQPSIAPAHVAVSDLRFTSPSATSALCLACHADATIPVAVQTTLAKVPPPPPHAPFAITKGKPHFDKSCFLCHQAQRSDKPFARDFRAQATCAGCHAEPLDKIVTRHAVVAGFAQDNASCLACHKDGSIGAFDHSKWFPINAASDKHAGLACASCHVNPADRTQVNCVSCHQQPQRLVSIAAAHQGKVSGTIWQGVGPSNHGQTCTICHADAQVSRVATHGWPPGSAHAGTPFSITAGKHALLQCTACHLDQRTDKPWALSFHLETCTTCHHTPAATSPPTLHGGVSGYSYTTAGCLACHPNGLRP